MKSPAFIMSRESVKKNLQTINNIEQRSDVKILHTLKSFNQSLVLPTIASKLSGMSVGNRTELRMAKEAKAENIHLYAPAYKEEALKEIIDQVTTISFNSLNQWYRFKSLSQSTSMGLRINPKLYLPIPYHCNPNEYNSRLGQNYETFIEEFNRNPIGFKTLEGLHFHALFQSSEVGTSLLLDHILEYYREILPQLKWINLGGGHQFTSHNFNVNNFDITVNNFKLLYPKIELYFEPGEAVVKDTGIFITTVLDIIKLDEQDVVILDTSTETHLLDVAIVNKRLMVKGTQSNSTPHFYQLTGNSCLQGDIIGEYFFTEPLSVGSHVIFEDMISYSMVKTTTFNGIEEALFVFE